MPTQISSYGDGYGSGDGHGYGDGKYWLAVLTVYVARWAPDARARLAAAKKAGAQIAYWRSGSDGRPCNGGHGTPATPGKIEAVPGPLKLCGPHALHAMRNPHTWKGKRLWIVALYGEIAEEDDKIGALKREIIGECLPP